MCMYPRAGSTATAPAVRAGHQDLQTPQLRTLVPDVELHRQGGLSLMLESRRLYGCHLMD